MKRPRISPSRSAPMSSRNSTDALFEGVRPAVQAGRFYPADAEELRANVETYLSATGQNTSAMPPVALLAPHAGYIYSGAVAGAAFAAVRGLAYTHVLVLPPSHFADF